MTSFVEMESIVYSFTLRDNSIHNLHFMVLIGSWRLAFSAILWILRSYHYNPVYIKKLYMLHYIQNEGSKNYLLP